MAISSASPQASAFFVALIGAENAGMYSELDQPAAFACTNRICSEPIFEPQGPAETVTRMMAASSASTVQ
jgi:hypothetical protein